ncbi:MAG: hypothetical protein LBH62_07140 [Nitrososphaerota archaeon]|uniref:hypothetical protein n=1 Tax=Candidatus Bathycorpusculum sp. TaxID=2994959 RepID=UPI002837501D|nr:hypothetical protein [Candidatus Termiticorpusculum sp.]MCL2257168.1 hypothetical protein [Candidatus Termiticorpusculum sp.]MCL2292528.1 hypothetical protein [Candidatus Termiticorpusculum sp.]MDR0461186.1 hypothetical protein [Nitrososphaerota archaeon]
MTYAIFDASCREAFANFEMDPQNIPLITINTIDKRVITSMQKTLTFFKELQNSKTTK